MKIIICTLAVNDWYREVVKYNIINLRNYCDKHGYTFVYDNESVDTVYIKNGDVLRDPPWYKIKLIKKILLDNPDIDYCIWIDADSHLLNSDIKMESFIEKYMCTNVKKQSHMLVAKEARSDDVLNTGVMFVKNSQYSINMLNLIWDNSNECNRAMHEQASLSNLYQLNIKNLKDNIVVLTPDLQNEFLSYWYMYTPGNCFIMHATRCSHDIQGFIFTMDLFCPIKMDEESVEQYEKRMKWLHTDESIVTIEKWRRGEHCPRIPSARNAIGWF